MIPTGHNRGHLVPIVIILVLLVFWMVMALRAFQRGDLLMAGVFVAVGIALTVWRLRSGARHV